MRFQDWDVLLFPGGSQVPIREFRTVCFAQANHMTNVPVLTCFVPSLPTGAPFSVSVHSWTKPVILGNNNNGYVPGMSYLWRFKLVIDGVAVLTETCPEDVHWPKPMDKASIPDFGTGKRLSLAFPRFHRSIMSQTHWNACDEIGRIKLQLSAGYEIVEQDGPKFVKIVDHVIFSFQPAPLDILERSGIAWPNPNLPVVNNPLQAPEARHVSTGGQPAHEESDPSSRSTSSYSIIPPNIYPSLQHVTRLPSDQMQAIINALGGPAKLSTEAVMPPPPPPYRSIAPNALVTNNNRRGESSYSDVSMHTGCTSYPSCIVEEEGGHISHNPVPVVRSRKETAESTPAKRDFLSTVMDTPTEPLAITSPVEASSKKRTRAALKDLTINDGSPEKKDRPAKKTSKVTDSEDKENEIGVQ